METSLHQQLKTLYAGKRAQTEVRLDGFRIDAVAGNRLIEIQHGSLAAIRTKISRLLKQHRVLVVKPIVATRQLVKLDKRRGQVVARRRSPRRGCTMDFFDELVYFTRVFPHPNLTVEVPLVDIEEWRFPGHGRRRRWRSSDFQIADQKLVEVRDTLRLRSAHDLWKIVERPAECPFHTGHLAETLQTDRSVAQRVAYCLRETGAVKTVGKSGNAWLYQPVR